jgi:hypothetical protein
MKRWDESSMVDEDCTTRHWGVNFTSGATTKTMVVLTSCVHHDHVKCSIQQEDLVSSDEGMSEKNKFEMTISKEHFFMVAEMFFDCASAIGLEMEDDEDRKGC